MRHFLGFLASLLGGIGLIACVAGVIAAWVYRPIVTREGVALVEAVEDGAGQFAAKAKRVEEIVSAVRQAVEPATDRIKQLATLAQRNQPEDKERFKEIEAELTRRFDQVENIVELCHSALAVVNKTSRLAAALPFRDKNGAGSHSSQDLADTLTRIENGLSEFRKTLKRLQTDKGAPRERGEKVIALSRDLDERLGGLQTTLHSLDRQTRELRTDLNTLAQQLPHWMDLAAIIGSLVLTWIALGQFTLLRTGIGMMRRRTLA